MFKRRKHFIWKTATTQLNLGARTHIMGIVNVTPDSFSGDGCYKPQRAEKVPGLCLALKLIEEGADIVDIGGESTRPGAARVTVSAESSRVIPLIKELSRRSKTPISIDSYKPAVIARALDAGASIVNLIKGTPPSAAILTLIKRYKAGLILMHMRGTPRTMQGMTRYQHVINNISSALKDSLDLCRAAGIPRRAIVIDPGFGFAKDYSQNLSILRQLGSFKRLGQPILVGTSRKSFITKTLGNESDSRIMGTAATVCLAICSGAHIVRVHDVKCMRSVSNMADAVLQSNADMVPA